MISKNKKSKNKVNNNLEKYLFILLLSGYIVGLCIGSYFVFSNKQNAVLANNIAAAGLISSVIYFPAAAILKYSGILSGLIGILTVFSGIQNSIIYSNNILNSHINTTYSKIVTVLKDTSVIILLIIYITIIIIQISNNRYNLKKDIKYFISYFSGAVIVNIIEYILKNFIF